MLQINLGTCPDSDFLGLGVPTRSLIPQLREMPVMDKIPRPDFICVCRRKTSKPSKESYAKARFS